MQYNYTITEIHSCSRHDPPDVILHDAITDAPVRREGNDIIFPLGDGIIVRPHCAPNDTDRYLQTDAVELRIRNVEKISFKDKRERPCVGEKFIILGHKYRSNKRLYSLLLTKEGRSEQAWFDFTCDGAEYCFNGFSGDSDIQRARDHRRKTLETYIRNGQGQAVLMLRAPYMSDEERREYMDIVVYAALHDLRFDHQANTDRTQYLIDLLDSFCEEDRARMKDTIVQGWREVTDNGDFFSFSQYVNLLLRFAQDGDMDAGELIEKIYDRIREQYESRTEFPNGVDHLGDKYETLSRILGKAPKEEHVHIPRKPDEMLTIERVIEIVRSTNGTVFPYRFKQFFTKSATAHDAETLLEAARSESDYIIKGKLYSLFTCIDFPDDVSELITVAREWEKLMNDSGFHKQNTARFLQRAVERIRHPLVREYGFELIERGMAAEDEKERSVFIGYGFDKWAVNYDESCDLERMCEFLRSLPDYDGYNIRHDIDFSITHKMFDNRRYEDPRTYGFLVSLITHTPCSTCRRNAVKILAEHGMLQEAVRKECLYDCDLETRRIAENTVGI